MRCEEEPDAMAEGLGGGRVVTRAERECLRAMRYPDGAQIMRGVAVGGEEGRWRVAGWDLHRGLVIATSGGRSVRVPPEAVRR